MHILCTKLMRKTISILAGLWASYAYSGNPPLALVDEESCFTNDEYDGKNCIRNLAAFVHDFDGRQLRFREELGFQDAYVGIHDDAVDAGELMAYALDGEYPLPQTDGEQLELSLQHYVLLQEVEKQFVYPYDIDVNHQIDIRDDLNGDNSITAEDEEMYQRQHGMPILKDGEVLAQNNFK